MLDMWLSRDFKLKMNVSKKELLVWEISSVEKLILTFDIDTVTQSFMEEKVG